MERRNIGLVRTMPGAMPAPRPFLRLLMFPARQLLSHDLTPLREHVLATVFLGETLEQGPFSGEFHAVSEGAIAEANGFGNALQKFYLAFLVLDVELAIEDAAADLVACLQQFHPGRTPALGDDGLDFFREVVELFGRNEFGHLKSRCLIFVIILSPRRAFNSTFGRATIPSAVKLPHREL